MTQELRISNSEIQVYKQCKRRWYLAHYRKLKPLKENHVGPLAIGSRFHLGMQHLYKPGGSYAMGIAEIVGSIEDDRDKVTDPVELIQFDKDCKLVKVMFEGYHDWLMETGADAGLKVLGAETEIEAVLGEIGGYLVILMGKLDLEVVDEDGQQGIMDHKTAQSLSDPMLDLNEQYPTYLLINKLNGGRGLNKVTWNIARKVLRTGTAKPPFYSREEITITDQALRLFYEQITGTIRDLIEVRRRLDQGETHRSVCYPTPSRQCSYMCEFRVACPMFSYDPHFEDYLAGEYQVGNPYDRYEKSGELE